MKKLLIFTVFALIITLSGCTVKEAVAAEHVTDTIPETAMPAFYMSLHMPENVFLSSSDEDGRYAVFTHSDYEVIQEIFPADSLDDALIHLTGRDTEELHPICISGTPFEEYRYSWVTAGESGTLNCSGALFTDGEFYYSLSILCDSALEKEYREEFSEILSYAELEAV